MRRLSTDAPAALALIGLMCGLALGPLLVNGWWAAVGLVVVAPRVGRFALFAAIGIALALQTDVRRAREAAAFATLHPERFAVIEAPIERDWAPRGDAFVLRAPRFRANGVDFTEAIAIYARFEPPEIGNESTIRVEAFLRVAETGAYTASVKSPELLAYEGALPRWHPAAWNRALANRLEPHARDHELEVAMAHALVLGRGERLTDDVRASFRRGGTYHLLVFSGLQIALAAALLAALLRWLHRPRASDWLLLAFAAMAPLFIGPTASVSRAAVGIGLYALSRILKRPTSLENLWCVAALARLIAEPRDLTDASFHLTYAGAGALLFVGKHLTRRRWAAVIAGAELAIAPLTLHHFHQYAVGGAVLTLVMSPLIFAMLVASALAFAWPCDATFAAIGALHRLCGILNSLGLAGTFTAPPLPSLIAGFALALAAIAFLGERRRAAAICMALLVPIAGAVMRYAAARSVEHPRITFLDVGQGDAIALRTGARTVLVDGGFGPRILPLLVDRGIRRIDAAVLTHAHPDHCGGLVAVVEQLAPRSVWVSPRHFTGDCALRLLEACRLTATPIHLVRDGDTIDLGGLRIRTILPSRTFRRARENNASVVLMAEASGRRILLTGDIEREAEIDLADRDLRADVLKVPHHGSRTSSSPMLLDNVSPRLAVISCGRRNLFGHPHPSVLEALRERGVRVRRTDREGSIDVEIASGRLYVTSRRD